MTAILSSARRSFASRLHPSLAKREKPSLAVTLSITAIVAISLSCHLVTDSGDLDGVALFLLLIWTCGFVAGAYEMEVVENVLRSFSVILFSEIVTPLAGAALATTSLPLCDQALVHADRVVLGFDLWPNLTSIYPAWRGLLHLLAYAYVSLGWQPFLLAILLCLIKRSDECWRFVSAWTVSLLLCTLIFPLCPAVGAYAHFNITVSDVPEIIFRPAWHSPGTLQSFRTGSVHRLDLAALDGIVTMPSFHACASILLAWSFRAVPWLRRPFALLNILMWTSSIPIGGHYAVDVVAGSLIAVLAIGLSTKFSAPTSDHSR